MINYILNRIKKSYNENKLLRQVFICGIKFFCIRDLGVVVERYLIHFIAFNLIIYDCLNYSKAYFLSIYRFSIVAFMLSIIILCGVLIKKASNIDNFTSLEINQISIESLFNYYSKRNKTVIVILFLVISYFIQIYVFLNFKLANSEPILVMASSSTMHGVYMYLLAVMMTYFAYQSRLFKIAYENRVT